MKVNPNIFRAYDIRGIADPLKDEPTDLTPETVYLIGQGTGTYLQKHYGKNLVVGRDNRLTGETLQKAFIDGLKSTGCNVTDVGLCTSPMLYWAVCFYKFDGGINITASHNPKEYNGVKIVAKDAHSVCGPDLQTILNIIESGDFLTGEGTETKKEIFKDYVADTTSRVDVKRKLKVVVDAGNATTGIFAPALLEAVGCEVIPLFCELDGTFPNHEANPEETKNMLDLMAKVKETGADLGIGFDGDGDRIGVVDELGEHYSADYLLVLLARDMLSRNPGAKVVFDVKVSQNVIDDIKKHGGEPVMSKTGHSFIEQKMKDIGALLGGEISGHMFFEENYYGFDDAFFAALKTLAILSQDTKTLSQHFADMPKTFITPEYKAYCPDDKKFQIVKEVSEHFVNLYDCITIDGVRINFDENSWGAVRCSNTSPNLTLRFESTKSEKIDEMKEIMAKVLSKYPEVDLSWNKK